MNTSVLSRIFFLSLLFLTPTNLVFSQVGSEELLPFDSTIRTGVLENGLTYFIKQNAKPENRVELRLAVNAGSLMEDDDQLGLAHVTEHMAFNGSENFDKNDLVSYLQSVGVKFGAHLNAYTSFDETVYILPIPSDDETIVEQGLTILEDWAGGVSFDQEELDKERGVVIEEWRLGQGARSRMLKEYLPVIFKGSRYAERLPIGTKESLETFDQEAIKRFYRDWYRPNLMAVIAVGDIDVDQMEAKIKSHFSGLENPENQRVRVEYDLPDNVDPLVKVTSDPEATNIFFNIMFKKEGSESTSVKNYHFSKIQGLFLQMINQRLSDLLQNANPPYLYASTYIGSPVSRKTTAFTGYAVPKPDDIKGGVTTLLEEIRRVELYGFYESELKTAKLNVMEAYESAYKERANAKSKGKADELVRHFLEQEPVPGIDYEYNYMKENLDSISLDDVNAIIQEWIKKENRVIYMTAPLKEDLELPEESEIISWVEEIEQKKLEALEEEIIETILIEEIPTGGHLIGQTSIPEIGVELLTLSNGSKIYLKQTDFKDDEIMFSAYRPGGISLAEDEKYWSANFSNSVVNASGIGSFSYTQLEKALAGKSVVLAPYISDLESGFNGNASPEDLETMFQLLHLYFNDIRRDEEAYQSLIERNKAILSNALSNPNYYFQDQLARILAQDNLRAGGIPTVKDLEQVDMDEALDFFKSQFDSPHNYTYFFTGNFDRENLIAMMEKYLGSEGNSSETKSSWKDTGVRPPKGMVDEQVYKGTEPKSSVVLTFHSASPYDRADSYFMKSFSEVLSIKLIETLREDIGGVYGVGASSQGHNKPYHYYDTRIRFSCSPENVDQLIEATLDEIGKIQKAGVNEEDLAKIKETQRREMELNWKENSFWLGAMKSYVKNDFDLKKMKELDARIETLESADIQSVSQKYLDTESFIKVVLYPEETKE